jgi:hypothetical protein
MPQHYQASRRGGGYQKPWIDWAPGPHRAFTANLSKSNTKSPPPVGYQISGEFGAVTARVSRADVFPGARGLIILPKSKNSKSQRSHRGLKYESVQRLGAHSTAARPIAWSFRGHYFSAPIQHSWRGGGRVKSLVLSRAVPRGSRARFSAKFRKLFSASSLPSRTAGGGRSLDWLGKLPRSANPENRRVIQGGG